MDSDTSICFKPRMAQFQETLSHFFDSPSSSSITANDKLPSEIVSISKQDQDNVKGSPSFVSDSSPNSLNSKKAKCSPIGTHIGEEQEILDSANGSYPVSGSVRLSPGSERLGPKTSGNYEVCFVSDALFMKGKMGKIVNNEKKSFFSDLVDREVKDDGKSEVGVYRIQAPEKFCEVILGSSVIRSDSELVSKKKQLLLVPGEKCRKVNVFGSSSKIVDENVDRLKGIKVLDETALIEYVVPFPIVCNCRRKKVEFVLPVKSTKKHRNTNVKTDDENRCSRRKSKGEKKALQFGSQEDSLCPKNWERTELAYSRDVLMALRFVNIVEQRKKWKDIYTGLGPVVGKEYYDLATFYPQKTNNLHFDPRQRFSKKEESPAVFGLMAARGRSNHMNVFVH